MTQPDSDHSSPQGEKIKLPFLQRITLFLFLIIVLM
jgi:hypothetical protein